MKKYLPGQLRFTCVLRILKDIKIARTGLERRLYKYGVASRYTIPGKLIKRFVVFSVSCLFAGITYAQEIFPPKPYTEKLKIEAKKAGCKISIDGRLNETDWLLSIPAKYFMECWPVQKKTASYETEVSILYDEKYVYIGAHCSNPKNQIYVQDLRRDFLYDNNELFGVFIDPFQDVQNPVPSFLVTPFGTQRDLLIYDDRIYDLNWDAVWHAKSFIADSFWSTEIAIPWSTLRYPSDSTTWGINFNRNIRSLYEVTGWSPWPRAYTVGRMAYAGLVTNLHPPKNKTNIRIQPYGLLNTSKAIGEKSNSKFQAGGEVKWSLSTTTSVEATFNTDFAQAEVDRQLINLNRTSVFFPEKRQFFLENANLFSIGEDRIFQPFFSRQIGLSETGRPLKINEGLRFIHQTGKKAVGGLFIRQSDNDTGTHSYFGVIRGQVNIGAKGRIGTITTLRYDEIDKSSNTVLSIDGFWHPAEPFYVRPVVSANLSAPPGKKGIAFFNELGYVKNKFNFKWFETFAPDGYIVKTGFLQRGNFIFSHPEFTFNLPSHLFGNKLKMFSPAVAADFYHAASSGKFEEANITVTPVFVTTHKGTTVSLSVLPSLQKIRTAFQLVPGISIDSGRYNFVRYNFKFNSNPSAPYSFLADISRGKFYNGNLESYTASARAVPIPAIAASISYTFNNFSGLDSTGKKKAKTHLLAPELRVSFTPKIQLTGFYQYNTVSNLGGLNLRFAWEYQPLSFIYLVFNNIKTIDDTLTPTPVNDLNGILKVSLVKQL